MKASIWLLLGLMLGGLQSQGVAGESVTGGGATFPFPIYSSWAFQYKIETGVITNYQPIGSGAGVGQIESRTLEFGASDEPQEPQALAKKNLLQFPVVVGGVVIIFNVPGIKKDELKLDSQTLCNIFLGSITTWSDERLKALNSDLQLPDEPIEVVYRSDGSGTTSIFTNYLTQTCSAWKEKVGHGKFVRFPVGICAKGNGGVAHLVARSQGSIGYVEFAYAKQNGLAYTQLKNAAGSFIQANLKSFEEAALSGEFRSDRAFYEWLTNSKREGAWPIAGATYVLLAKEKTLANRRVVRFFDWAFRKGDQQAEALTYAPLPQTIKDSIRKWWKDNGLLSSN